MKILSSLAGMRVEETVQTRGSISLGAVRWLNFQTGLCVCVLRVLCLYNLVKKEDSGDVQLSQPLGG